MSFERFTTGQRFWGVANAAAVVQVSQPAVSPISKSAERETIAAHQNFPAAQV